MLLAGNVLDHAERHADTGAGKAQVPVHPLGKVACDEWPQRRAQVDAHVEDGEAGVAPRVVPLVERTHDAAHVGLEQARADHDEGETDVEGWQRMERQGEVPQHDDDPAIQHAPVLAQPSVGDDPAEDGGGPDACGVGAVDRSRVPVIELEHVHHVEDEKGAHAVVAEALPHLGKEEGGEATRMAEEGRGLRVAGHGGRGLGTRGQGSGTSAMGSGAQLTAHSSQLTAHSPAPRSPSVSIATQRPKNGLSNA